VHVKWLSKALASLAEQLDYIAEDSPSAAARVERDIQNAVSLLAKYPAIGRAGRVAQTRELVVPNTPYVIPYRVRRGEIEIIRVLHAARKWPQKFS
jgi:toxin ParE1/3/4